MSFLLLDCLVRLHLNNSLASLRCPNLFCSYFSSPQQRAVAWILSLHTDFKSSNLVECTHRSSKNLKRFLLYSKFKRKYQNAIEQQRCTFNVVTTLIFYSRPLFLHIWQDNSLFVLVPTLRSRLRVVATAIIYFYIVYAIDNITDFTVSCNLLIGQPCNRYSLFALSTNRQ